MVCLWDREVGTRTRGAGHREYVELGVDARAVGSVYGEAAGVESEGGVVREWDVCRKLDNMLSRAWSTEAAMMLRRLHRFHAKTHGPANASAMSKARLGAADPR